MSEQKSFAVWITGLPASGKSTVATQLADQLKRRGVDVAVLESDALRHEFAKLAKSSEQTGYQDQERNYFYSALALLAHNLASHGVAVIIDATANRREYRDRARRSMANFVEVFVNTPLEVCIARDPKGIYREALAGRFHNVPGLQAEYEPPLHPEIVVDGVSEEPTFAATRILKTLEERRYL